MASGLDIALRDDRQHIRLHYNAHVELETLDRKYLSGKLRDIGLNSLYMSTKDRKEDFLVTGEVVKVKVTMRRGKSKLTLDMAAKIVRMDEGGLAVKFDNILKWFPIFVMFPATETN